MDIWSSRRAEKMGTGTSRQRGSSAFDPVCSEPVPIFSQARRPWLPLIAAAIALAVLAQPCRLHAALSPESPEVKAAIEKAIKYLESDAATDTRVGAKALVGLAMLKFGMSPDHPRITQAVAAIKGAVKVDDPAKIGMDIYSTGLSIIFLVDLDPSRYSPEIIALLQSLEAKQKPHGGWGYPERETGDTSMTQYGVLSSWEAKQYGFEVSFDSIERVADWLLRTQDPNGNFGYQGKLANSYNNLIKQDTAKLSMSAAGTGSLYICAELLGLAETKREDPNLPSGLKKVKKEEAQAEERKTNIDKRAFQEAQSRANRWIRANFQVDPDGWTHYYLYALERYWSFRENSEGKGDDRWYPDGARYLMKTQAANGSWKSQAGEVPDTAFGTLFLLRSMKKSIEKARDYGSGMMVGGRGLPKDTDSVRVQQGKVVATAQLGALEQILNTVDDPESEGFSEAIEALSNLPPETGKAILSKHAQKLRELAGGNAPDARIAAIRALAKTGSLDCVPTLVFALGDPEPGVMQEARAGLLRLSRKFEGFGPPDRPTDDERAKAIEAWKQWYRSIRPDAEFDD